MAIVFGSVFADDVDGAIAARTGLNASTAIVCGSVVAFVVDGAIAARTGLYAGTAVVFGTDEGKFASTAIVCGSVFAGAVDGAIVARTGLNANTGAVSRGADNAGMFAAILGSTAGSVFVFASPIDVLVGTGDAPMVCDAFTAIASVQTFISGASDAIDTSS